MKIKQSSLKNILTNMIGTLTPEIEQDFDDYIEATSVKDTAMCVTPHCNYLG